MFKSYFNLFSLLYTTVHVIINESLITLNLIYSILTLKYIVFTLCLHSTYMCHGVSPHTVNSSENDIC
jgi:hypothetical protein